MKRLSRYNFIFNILEDQIFLIYNSYSNALFELDWKQGEELIRYQNSEFEKYDLKGFNDKEFEMLYNGGIIISSETNEISLLVTKIKNRKEKLIKTNGIIGLTISVTNSCNLNCVYCFEGHKQGGVLEKKNQDDIVRWVESEIQQKSVKNVRTLSVAWFGGEPTMVPDVISRLSSSFLDLTEQHKINYCACIITNGTMLSPDFWDLLAKCKVERLQISIDGGRGTHNRKRISKNNDSYEVILRNLSCMPEGFKVDIRVNVDEEVANSLDEFLNDLFEYGIWPQRAREVRIYLANKDYYPFSDERKELYLTDEEFYPIKEEFRKKQLIFYNKWADKNQIPHAKLAIKYPDEPIYFCGPASDPLNLTIDDSGYIHKCWDDVNDKNRRIQHISKFDLSSVEYSRWLFHDKTERDTCRECKFLPICCEICPKKVFEKRNRCSEWKYLLEGRLRNYYSKHLKNIEQSMSREEFVIL